MLVKIVEDELRDLMGGEAASFQITGSPAVILIAGLQGSGKTTFTHKLAHWAKSKKGKSPLMVAGDVYRPAAIDQLISLGEKIDIPVFYDKEDKSPVSIAKAGIDFAKKNGHDVVIIDTAGRLAVDEVMMTEIQDVKRAIQPQETLFVVDSMTGQDAVNTADAFNQTIDFDGVVLTKLDGDTRGGAALSIQYTVGKPIKFASSGEKVDSIDLFHPDRMARRILGMGDIVTLVERAQQDFDEEEARKVSKKLPRISLTSMTLWVNYSKLKKWAT